MPRSPSRWLAVSLVALYTCAATAAEPTSEAPAPATKVSFAKQVLPIFRANCQGCHQPAKPQGEYVMTAFDRLLIGGASEQPAIVPGAPDDSNLVLMITPTEGKADMPKGKPALADAELALIRQWIAEGASDDTPDSEREVVDAAHPPVYRALPVVTALDFSPDGSLLAVSGYHEVLLHKADGSAPVARLVGMSERIQSAVFSPDGSKLAVVGGSPGRLGEVQIWDVAERKLTLSIPVTYDTIYGASWSPDGSKIAFGCADNTVRAIDAKTGQQVLYQGAHNDWVMATVFSTDASHLVSVSRDMSMKLIEVPTQRFVDNITSITPGALKGGLLAVDRHPQRDELLVGGSDGVPKIFRMYRLPDKSRQIGDDFNLIRNFDSVAGRIFAVEYSPDGAKAVVGSSSDGQGEIKVYSTEDAKFVSAFEGQPGSIFAATFSPDGRVVAAGGFSGKVVLMEAETGKLIREFVPVPLDQLSAAEKGSQP